MTKYVCDNCGKEQQDELSFIKAQLPLDSQFKLNNLEVCTACQTTVKDYMQEIDKKLDAQRLKLLLKYFSVEEKEEKEKMPAIYEWVKDGGTLRTRMRPEYIKWKEGR